MPFLALDNPWEVLRSGVQTRDRDAGELVELVGLERGHATRRTVVDRHAAEAVAYAVVM